MSLKTSSSKMFKCPQQQLSKLARRPHRASSVAGPNLTQPNPNHGSTQPMGKLCVRILCCARSMYRSGVRPSGCLSRRSTAAATCGWFAAELGREQQISIDSCRRRVPATDRCLLLARELLLQVASCREPRYAAQRRLV